ncbi:hypothetical protein DRO54_11825 [Candidatus Bathyarchaeota archaeon]|nr:MAG: hypothetical protein DRO54_11825 [Candidatus Bathyarchaeota archaeon]
MTEDTESKPLKSMADLLRRGATLTNLACPVCASPLFKLKSGELWCAKCQKQVIVVKEGETPLQAAKPLVLTKLEATVIAKIEEIEERIKNETDTEKLQKLGAILSSLLDNLEKIRKIKERES